MRNPIIAALALSLGACLSAGGDPPPLPPLAEEAGQPALALLEHVLTGHFAAFGGNPPTTCAALRPGPLTAEQEEALITRFVRLAPAARCRAQGSGHVDAITGEPAGVVVVHDLVCREPTQCAASVSAPGSLPRRYALRFEVGAWRFIADPRALLE